LTNLERRARRLEEEAELSKQAKQAESERVLREALTRVSTPELRAMHEHFERAAAEEWTEEDEPLMRRLLMLVEEVRCEEAGGFPWQVEMREEREDDH
jgi:hypothetical protein